MGPLRKLHESCSEEAFRARASPGLEHKSRSSPGFHFEPNTRNDVHLAKTGAMNEKFLHDPCLASSLAVLYRPQTKR